VKSLTSEILDKIDPKYRHHFAYDPHTPIFVFASDVVELMGTQDAKKAIDAVVEAEICKLPFNPMIVEFQMTEKWYYCVLLSEKDDTFSSTVITNHVSGFTQMATMERLTASMLQGVTQVEPAEICELRELTSQLILTMGVEAVNAHEKLHRGISHLDTYASLTAVYLSILMLNTRGIEKERIVPSEKLQKARLKRRKAPLPSYTNVRIGTIYDRNNAAIKIGSSGKMSVHWRAGHVRNQVCGTNREDRKLIYIQPVLVNYDPNSATKPLVKHVKV